MRALIWLFFNGALAASTTYTITDLGTLGGNFSTANGINNAGWVTGQSSVAGNSQQHAFFWNGTQMVDLATFGGTVSVGNGINDAGHVGGYAQTAGNANWRAFYWDGTGTISSAGTLGGNYNSASAINNSDQMTGVSYMKGAPSTARFTGMGR